MKKWTDIKDDTGEQQIREILQSNFVANAFILVFDDDAFVYVWAEEVVA